MLEAIFQNYGLYCRHELIRGRSWLVSGERLYQLVPARAFHHSDFEELAGLCYHLTKSGESDIATIVRAQNGGLSTTINDESQVLLLFPEMREATALNGEALAAFHQKCLGFSFQALADNPYLQWSTFWSRRMDDLEERFRDCETKTTLSAFEREFREVYPYFSGRAENAIQYVTDLMIDEGMPENPVICHHRLSEQAWNVDGAGVKSPVQWVVDHPARDLAEWLRTSVLFGARSEDDADAFLHEYLKAMPLSGTGLGMVFARLLLPLPFIEAAEGYFTDRENEPLWLGRLEHCLDRIDVEELFLKHYANSFISRLAQVEWLRT